MPTITPFLWYDNQAEEAMDLYTSIFKNAKVLSVNKAQGRTISVSFVPGRPTVHRAQRRAALQVQRGDVLLRRLHDSAGDRPLLDEADGGRRRTRPMRLAQGQVRRVLADRSERAWRDARRQGPVEGTAGPLGDASDEQAGPRPVAERLRRQMKGVVQQ